MSKIKVYGRFSFVNVHAAKGFTDEKTGSTNYRYDINVLIPKGDKQIKLLEQTRDLVAETKWGKKTGLILPKLIAAEKTFLRDGDMKDYPGYEGHMYVAAANTVKPLVIGADRMPLAPDSGLPYGGCYGYIVIDVYAMDKYGAQVNASLKGVQFVKHGEAFAGGPPASEEDFEDLSDTGEEDDPETVQDEYVPPVHAQADTRATNRQTIPSTRQSMGRQQPEQPSRPGNRGTKGLM
jgi:hypothetical protein